MRCFLPALLLLASCSPDPLQGRIVLSGSATLAPFISARAEQWAEKHPRVDVRVEAIGSDAGLEKLVQYDEADVALMSRPLVDVDRASNVELWALPVAWDAVSLVVPVSNTWVHSLSRDQVVRAFTSAALWSDLDASWPALPVHRFVLGPSSGTADLFAGALFGGRKDILYQAPSVQISEDDRILARGLARVEGSLGFLGWTTVRESSRELRVVALDGVRPSVNSIRDRSYGLPRQLWLVFSRDTWAKRSEVRALVRSLFEDYPSLLEGTGLVPLEAEELGLILKRIANDS